MNRQPEQAIILLAKARQDETAASKFLASEDISDEIIGFHCQQAMEKLLKALPSHYGVRYRRTHDLREILDLMTDAGYDVPEDLHDIDSPTPYASVFRCEASSPDLPLDRHKALDMVRRLREWVEPQLPGQTA